MTSSLKSLLQSRLQRRLANQPVLQRAQSLLASIDAGGIPLNPAIVNDIARQLGLDVSTRAPMDETIERIRAAVARR